MRGTSIQTTAALRRFNRKAILSEIFYQGTVSRTGLVASSGLTGTAITRITRELIDAGLVEEGSQLPRLGVPGRKETELSISGAVAHVIGISLHVDSRSIVLADVLGNFKDQVNLDIPLSESPELVIDRIGDLILELIARNNLHKQQIIGLTIALAGKIDPRKGILLESRIYRWKNLPIRDLLYEKVGIPIAIENLNNVINLAESYFGVSQGYSNILTVRVGTGYVGASLMIDGRLVRGRNSAAGLIHHVPLNANDISCECGLRGCLNTVSSGFGILARAKRARHVSFDSCSFPDSNEQIAAILQSALDGNQAAKKVLKQGGQALGTYIAQLTETICPQAIVIAGKVGRSPDYIDGFTETWEKSVSRDNYANVHVFRSFKSVIEGTVEFAIDQFLLSMDLNLEPLAQTFTSMNRRVA